MQPATHVYRRVQYTSFAVLFMVACEHTLPGHCYTAGVDLPEFDPGECSPATPSTDATSEHTTEAGMPTGESGTTQIISESTSASTGEINPESSTTGTPCIPGEPGCTCIPDEDPGCTCVHGGNRPCGEYGNVGTCIEGVQFCDGGLWGDCIGEVGPADDVCDGFDNDCDSNPDNIGYSDCTCLHGETVECGTDVGECTIGESECIAGQWSPCDGIGPTEEMCDDDDDDCDDEVDNLSKGTCTCIHGTQEPCGTDVGECTIGKRLCVDGIWGQCDGIGPTEETCDGDDDDCDDEDDNVSKGTCSCKHLAVEECGINVGECISGTRLCSSGVWGPCSDQGPTPETCDGHDNDCNGIADDGMLAGCGYSIIPFDVPCDNNTHEVDGFKPAAGQKSAIVPVITHYGYTDNDMSYWINWTPAGDKIIVQVKCSSEKSLRGYVVVLGLPDAAEILTTDFVVAPQPGDACGTLTVALPKLDDELYSDTLRLITLSSVVGNNDDDMSWQVRLENSGDDWSYWGRINGNSGSMVKGTILQIGLPAGYQAIPAQPQFGCFKQKDDGMAVKFTKDAGHAGVILVSVPHYVTEDASERDGVDSCDVETHVPVSTCDTNTGDWHGFNINTLGSMPTAASEIDVFLSSDGNKNESAIGIFGYSLQFPSSD